MGEGGKKHRPKSPDANHIGAKTPQYLTNNRDRGFVPRVDKFPSAALERIKKGTEQ